MNTRMRQPKGFIVAMPLLVALVVVALAAAGGSWWYANNRTQTVDAVANICRRAYSEYKNNYTVSKSRIAKCTSNTGRVYYQVSAANITDVAEHYYKANGKFDRRCGGPPGMLGQSVEEKCSTFLNDLHCESTFQICDAGTLQASNNNNVNTDVAVNANTTVNANVATNSNTNTAPDPTAGWKTYTNNQFGFRFQYPSDYTLTEGGSVMVSLSKKDAAMTLDITSKKLEPNNIQGIYGKMDTKAVAVGTQNGYQYGEGDGGCGGDVIQTALQNDQILQLDFGTCDGEKNVLITDMAQRNPILKTFTFFDPASYWQNYTNTALGYSLQYPTGWTVTERNELSDVTGKPVRNISIKNPASNNYLLLGIRKVGSTTLLDDRTGVGAGDFAGSDTVYIADTKVTSNFLQYKNKIKEIWYHNADANLTTIDGYEVLAEFRSKVASDSLDLSNSTDYTVMNAILSSLLFTK